jgi:hypothetical protein
VDLGLDDAQPGALAPLKRIKRAGRRIRILDDDAGRDGDAVLGEQIAGLVFVDLHGEFL